MSHPIEFIDYVAWINAMGVLGVEYVIINAITEKTKTRLFDLELPVASTKFSRGNTQSFSNFSLSYKFQQATR